MTGLLLGLGWQTIDVPKSNGLTLIVWCVAGIVVFRRFISGRLPFLRKAIPLPRLRTRPSVIPQWLDLTFLWSDTKVAIEPLSQTAIYDYKLSVLAPIRFGAFGNTIIQIESLQLSLLRKKWMRRCREIRGINTEAVLWHMEEHGHSPLPLTVSSGLGHFFRLSLSATMSDPLLKEFPLRRNNYYVRIYLICQEHAHNRVLDCRPKWAAVWGNYDYLFQLSKRLK